MRDAAASTQTHPAEAGFDAFVAARWQPLVRTAYLLTGDHSLAEDLVQTALVRTHRHWRRVEAEGDPTAYVRKTIYHLHVSDWRRRFRGPGSEVLFAVSPEPRASHDEMAAVDDRDQLWAAPPSRRGQRG
jgi:DNA-directed RNA polymerase specialized sigma24 family protein